MFVLSVVLFTVAFGFLLVFVFALYQFTYWRRRGIPYTDTVPIIGVLAPIFWRKKSIADLVIDAYNACPGTKYYGSMDFSGCLLIVKDPEIVKEIGVKSFAHFQNHRNFVEDDFDPILSRNLFSLKDERWRQMRTTLSPSFTASKMKYMFQLVSKCSLDFVEYLKDHPDLTVEMDLRDVYTRYTNDVIATTAFGISVNSLKDRDNAFYTNGRITATFEGFGRILKFMLAKVFPNLMRLLGFTFLPGEADRFFKRIIYDTIKERDEKCIVRPDMIHLLMQARHNEHGMEMTEEDIIAQAFIFFLAGFDASSRLMCFASHLLSHHSAIQERLRQEIDTILGEEQGDISYETLGRMKYMDMVLSETLRLYPSTPFLDRVCGESYKLPPSTLDSKALILQPNESIWIPILGFHRDPNFFPEPDKFDPERFNEENKANIKPYTYMPFGIGPRKCIGERFALMETKILIARLLKHFLFKPSGKTTQFITFAKDGSVMGPANGFWMRLEPRKLQ